MATVGDLVDSFQGTVGNLTTRQNICALDSGMNEPAPIVCCRNSD